jgi:hypothetical protein
MEATCSSETSVDFQWTTRCYVLGVKTPHNHRSSQQLIMLNEWMNECIRGGPSRPLHRDLQWSIVQLIMLMLFWFSDLKSITFLTNKDGSVPIKILKCILKSSRDSNRLCGLVVRVPGYRSRGTVFDFRRHQIIWEVVGLERGQLSLVRVTELSEWKSSGSGLENRD